MKLRGGAFIIACIAVLATATPLMAHRLDEYLQAATITVSSGRIVIRLRLVAGVKAAPAVLAQIDRNGDGILSAPEQAWYSEQVLRDLSLELDGKSVPLRLVTDSFPDEAAIREGLGDIVMTFDARVPHGSNRRQLSFRNHHQSAIAVYLVNTLVPEDPAIHVTSQDRARDQSEYRLGYVDGSLTSVSADDAASLEHSDRVALLRTYFWHGVHHILTGFDHLLFLAALVLGAASLWELVKVVTTFTIAHSTTLTLAALGWVHLPSSVVEPLIAASIVFVATQNVFWPASAHGRSRLVVAFFFGLFHGLGFAGGLLDIMHQMPTTIILLAIAGFSLGVEAGNQVVLIPLFTLLQSARKAQWFASPRALVLQKAGSAAVSVAGLYYLGIALTAR